MATILKNILSFTGLTVGVPVAVPHHLNVNGIPVKPAIGGLDAGGFTVTADTVNVTVTRLAAGPEDVHVYVEHWHTIEAVTPVGSDTLNAFTPFFFSNSGGGSSTGNEQSFAYTVLGTEPDLDNLVIPLPTVRATATYLVFPSQGHCTAQLGMNVEGASQQMGQFTLSLSTNATTDDVFNFIVKDPT